MPLLPSRKGMSPTELIVDASYSPRNNPGVTGSVDIRDHNAKAATGSAAAESAPPGSRPSASGTPAPGAEPRPKTGPPGSRWNERLVGDHPRGSRSGQNINGPKIRGLQWARRIRGLPT
jgi:hypothetical protein